MPGYASVTTIEVSDFDLDCQVWASDSDTPIVHVVMQRAACEFRLNVASEREIDALEEQLRLARFALQQPTFVWKDGPPACEIEVVR